MKDAQRLISAAKKSHRALEEKYTRLRDGFEDRCRSAAELANQKADESLEVLSVTRSRLREQDPEIPLLDDDTFAVLDRYEADREAVADLRAALSSRPS